jgi:hypothetical protein
MKKLKAFVCVVLLSMMLVGNASANDPTGGSVLSFFTYAVEQVVSFLDAGSSCPIRQCTNCRPTERDENGNCRPRD